MIYQKVYKLYAYIIFNMGDIKVSNLIKFYTVVLLNKGPKYGYELIKELEHLFGKEISPAHVYPFLKTLQKNKLVEVKKTGSRDKKSYYITKKGREFTSNLLIRFNDVIGAFIESKVKKCAHCECEIYKNGFEKVINGKKLTFCCEHCANNLKHEKISM